MVTFYWVPITFERYHFNFGFKYGYKTLFNFSNTIKSPIIAKAMVHISPNRALSKQFFAVCLWNEDWVLVTKGQSQMCVSMLALALVGGIGCPPCAAPSLDALVVLASMMLEMANFWCVPPQWFVLLFQNILQELKDTTQQKFWLQTSSS